MTARYDRHGIRFQYPENWQLVEESVETWPQSLCLESPDGAFWSVTIHPTMPDPYELADRIMKMLRNDYEHFEAENADQRLGDHEMLGYDMMFFHKHILAGARLRIVQVHGRTYSYLYQAEDRDMQRLADVFDAVTLSFLQSL